MKFLTKAQQIGPAALIMATSVFLSRFMGLIRDKVISYFYGAGPETDIYFASFAIPDFINYLLAGGYFSITLIPLLSRFFKEDEDSGWRFFSAALGWVTIAVCTLTGIAWIFAHELAVIAAPGFGAAETARLATFLRIILPAQACFLPGACFTAILFMRRQFSIPALTPLIYNCAIILMGIVFLTLEPESGMEGFLWGVLLGAAVGSLVLPFLAVKHGDLKLIPCLKHPGLKKFILLALPLMLGQSIVVLDEQFIRIFGSLGPEGSVSLLNYARRIMMVPVGVVAQAAGVASYPFLAALVAKGDEDGFNDTINKALLTSLTVIVPLSFWIMAAARPTMRLIFEQGSFNAAATQNSSVLLTIMLAAAGFWAVQQVLGRGFYANENTLTPVLVGTASTLASLPIYVWMGKSYGAPGVAFAGVMGMLLYNLILVWRWNEHYGHRALSGLILRSAALLICAVPAASLARIISNLTEGMVSTHPLLSAFFSLGFSFVAFILVYILICRLATPILWKENIGLIKRFSKKNTRA